MPLDGLNLRFSDFDWVKVEDEGSIRQSCAELPVSIYANGLSTTNSIVVVQYEPIL